MDSQQIISNYVTKLVAITHEEGLEFAAAFTQLNVKKRQFIVQPGFIAPSRYLVVKGSLRAYVVADEGQEHTIQLAIEDWWISDYNSYIFQQPAKMFVMAMEDSLLLQLSYQQESRLKAANPKYETFFRILAERSVASMQRRIVSNLTLSAEERYEQFIETYPSVVSRFPQYVIASYLGMTTEFLSKIRNQRLRARH